MLFFSLILLKCSIELNRLENKGLERVFSFLENIKKIIDEVVVILGGFILYVDFILIVGMCF